MALSRREQEQAVGGNGDGWLALHTGGDCALELLRRPVGFLVTEIDFYIPTPKIALEEIDGGIR
jgi:hypothetical protein